MNEFPTNRQCLLVALGNDQNRSFVLTEPTGAFLLLAGDRQESMLLFCLRQRRASPVARPPSRGSCHGQQTKSNLLTGALPLFRISCQEPVGVMLILHAPVEFVPCNSSVRSGLPIAVRPSSGFALVPPPSSPPAASSPTHRSHPNDDRQPNGPTARHPNDPSVLIPSLC